VSTKPLVLDGPSGRIEIAADALDAVVTGAVGSVAGAALARGRRVLEVTTHGDAADVQVAITAEAGRVLPELGEEVQGAVAEALTKLTARQVRVDVSVVGLTS
jgi:uncharacterized alkaline shock family protein YloU